MTDDIRIRHDLQGGDLGELIALHGRVYEPLEGFGLRFEAFVARTIAEYVLDNDCRGRVWLAHRGRELVGCTAIALRNPNKAQLRWVLVDPAARGIGLGRALVEKAIDFSRENGCSEVFLETTDGLEESSALYRALGFAVISETRAELWDGVRPLIVMRLDLMGSEPERKAD